MDESRGQFIGSEGGLVETKLEHHKKDARLTDWRL